MIFYKCIGCGINLQNSNPLENGYTQNLENKYCLTCFKFINYGTFFENNVEINKTVDILKTLEKIRVYFVLDLYNLESSALSEFTSVLNNHEIIVIVNKVDLFENITSKEKIESFIHNFLQNRSINYHKLILISKKSIRNLKTLTDEILNYQGNQYIVGVSNTGKSTIINAILGKKILTASYLINTTQDLIKFDLENNANLFDTAGLKRKYSILNFLNFQGQKKFNLVKPIKQKTFQINKDTIIFIDIFIWFKFINVKKMSVHIYNSVNLNIHRTNIGNEKNYFQKHKSELLDLYLLEKTNNLFNVKKHYKKNDLITWYIPDLCWINFKVEDDIDFEIISPIFNENNIFEYINANDFIWYN